MISINCMNQWWIRYIRTYWIFHRWYQSHRIMIIVDTKTVTDTSNSHFSRFTTCTQRFLVWVCHVLMSKSSYSLFDRIHDLFVFCIFVSNGFSLLSLLLLWIFVCYLANGEASTLLAMWVCLCVLCFGMLFSGMFIANQFEYFKYV